LVNSGTFARVRLHRDPDRRARRCRGDPAAGVRPWIAAEIGVDDKFIDPVRDEGRARQAEGSFSMAMAFG